MSLSSRTLRRTVYSLLAMLSGVCAAQQFQNAPAVQLTGGRVTSIVAGSFQSQQSGPTDILYLNAPTVSGGVSSITAGELLYSQGFHNLSQNQLTFQNVTKAVAALGDFNNDGLTDYAFALTPQNSQTIELCVYYGTGASAGSGQSSYSPVTAQNGCLTFPASGSLPPVISYIAAFPLRSNPPSVPQFLIEDSANNILYQVDNNGTTGSNGNKNGYTTFVYILGSDGAGPIYTGDFDGDGQTDFIVNGQTGQSASIYLTAVGRIPEHVYKFAHNVHSMLMQDMDGDGHPDMVVEGDNGVIEIHHGNPDGSFATASEGGTAAGVDGFSGNGGHLAAINPTTLDILTTTPIGLSVLQGHGTLNYTLQGIYNIGSGRTSFALGNFLGSGKLDLAVDSAEGVAVIPADANGDGGFRTSRAYTTFQPGLSAVVGKFRNATNNPSGNLDVVVATGATQAQLLMGNGDGTFNSQPGSPANTSGGPTLDPSLASYWSSVLSGDFDGDGNLDIAYALTGLNNQVPINGGGPEIYVQYGNGDGSFQGPVGVSNSVTGQFIYDQSVAGNFNGDSITDLATINPLLPVRDETLFGGSGRSFALGMNHSTFKNPSGSQVAAGCLKTGCGNQQDLVFIDGLDVVPYKNSGDGINFTPMTGLTLPIFNGMFLLTDIDGDGNGDIVQLVHDVVSDPANPTPSKPNALFIAYGNGDGTFNPSWQVINLSRNYYLGAVADMNGDGLPDIVMSDGYVVSVLYNKGHRTFGGEQHFLAGQGINSISVADVNGDGLPDVVVANGGATIANVLALGAGESSTPPPPVYHISLTPNADVNTGGITVLLNSYAAQQATGTLTVAPEPSSFGAAFTITATLSSAAGVAEPTGTVQFSINGATVGSPVTVAVGTTSSTANYTVAAGNTYAAGAYTISAAYSGDGANSPATFSDSLGTHQITGVATTTGIFMCISPNPGCPAPPAAVNPTPTYVATLSMYYGQSWNGIIQTAANDGSALTGTVNLNDDYNGVTTTLCVLPVLGGSCPTSVGTTQGTSVGTNILTGFYLGDASHLPSTSPTVTINVIQDLTSGAALTGAPNPSPQGQPVTFTATLTGNFAAPTGAVTFYILPPGTSLTVPIGTGTFVPGAGLSSTATFTTTTLPVGTDAITANYAGTPEFAAATYPIISETITPPLTGSFTLTVTPSPVSVGVGYATLLTVTVTPNNGFAQNVSLACGTMPNETTCLIDNPVIAGGSGTTELLLQTAAPHSCGTSQPYFLGSNGGGPRWLPFGLPALAGLLAFFIPGRRRWLRALIGVAIAVGVTQMTGCGNCTDLGTRPATYTFQVTGTAAGTSEVETKTVTLTVAI